MHWPVLNQRYIFHKENGKWIFISRPTDWKKIMYTVKYYTMGAHNASISNFGLHFLSWVILF